MLLSVLEAMDQFPDSIVVLNKFQKCADNVPRGELLGEFINNEAVGAFLKSLPIEVSNETSVITGINKSTNRLGGLRLA
jgi:hypothetical protein